MCSSVIPCRSARRTSILGQLRRAFIDAERRRPRRPHPPMRSSDRLRPLLGALSGIATTFTVGECFLQRPQPPQREMMVW